MTFRPSGYSTKSACSSRRSRVPVLRVTIWSGITSWKTIIKYEILTQSMINCTRTITVNIQLQQLIIMINSHPNVTRTQSIRSVRTKICWESRRRSFWNKRWISGSSSNSGWRLPMTVIRNITRSRNLRRIYLIPKQPWTSSKNRRTKSIISVR